MAGAGFATYLGLSKVPGINPRARALYSLGMAGISGGTMTANNIIDSPTGFTATLAYAIDLCEL